MRDFIEYAKTAHSFWEKKTKFINNFFNVDFIFIHFFQKEYVVLAYFMIASFSRYSICMCI